MDKIGCYIALKQSNERGLAIKYCFQNWSQWMTLNELEKKEKLEKAYHVVNLKQGSRLDNCCKSNLG